MKNGTSALAINKSAILTLTILTGIAAAAPMLFKQQLVTGSIVNAALITGAALLGVQYGLLIGILPSTIALLAGTLNPALAPMIPFLIAGNAILVVSFAYLNKISFWLGATVAAAAKFAFLYGTSTVVTGMLDKHLAAAVTVTLSWPQLVTALIGGALAFGTVKLINRRKTA
jgi:hypothetical protein